jgi:hypothetical protein
VFALERHWSLSWTRQIQSTSSQLISFTYILILYSRLCLNLPSGLLLKLPYTLFYLYNILVQLFIGERNYNERPPCKGSVSTISNFLINTFKRPFKHTDRVAQFSLQQCNMSLRPQRSTINIMCNCIYCHVVNVDGDKGWNGNGIYWTLAQGKYEYLWQSHSIDHYNYNTQKVFSVIICRSLVSASKGRCSLSFGSQTVPASDSNFSFTTTATTNRFDNWTSRRYIARNGLHETSLQLLNVPKFQRKSVLLQQLLYCRLFTERLPVSHTIFHQD